MLTDVSLSLASDLQALHDDSSSFIVRPKVIEALGSSDVQHWFRQRRRDVQNMNSWERRAFIYGARSLRRDEYRPFLKSLAAQRLDQLTQVVARYCQSLVK